MKPDIDLQHRLPDHAIEAQTLNGDDDTDVVAKTIAYAAAHGVSREELTKALNAFDTTVPQTYSLVENDAYKHAQQTYPTQQDTENVTPLTPTSKLSMHLSTTSVLFYIGGILLFVGILVGIYQEGDATESTGVAFSLGCMSALFWVLSYICLRSVKSDEDTVRSGLGDSSLLVGSLFMFACAYQSLMLISDAMTDTPRLFFAIMTLWLTTIALLHFAFDRVVHRLLSISLAALSAIGAFYAFLWALLLNANSVSVYTFMVVLSGIYTFAIGSVFQNGEPGRRELAKTFHSFGGLIGLGALYSLMLTGTHEVLWTIVFPAILYGAFTYSIRSRSKTFLATGSLFLIMYVSTVILKYFAEGLGPAVAFIVAAVAITGSAIFSLYLRKKYFLDTIKK